jgi:hypothetical protein
MKQTAVEWLVEEFKEKLTGNNLPNWVLDVIQQAKAMEKEQIIDAYLKGYLQDVPNPSSMQYYEPLAEQFYNETFKQQEQ